MVRRLAMKQAANVDLIHLVLHFVLSVEPSQYVSSFEEWWLSPFLFHTTLKAAQLPKPTSNQQRKKESSSSSSMTNYNQATKCWIFYSFACTDRSITSIKCIHHNHKVTLNPRKSSSGNPRWGRNTLLCQWSKRLLPSIITRSKHWLIHFTHLYD